MEIVLNSYGGSLSRSNSNFLVCNDETSQLVPVYGVTAIYVWRSTRVSTDALLLALDNDIDIVLMDRRGDVKGGCGTASSAPSPPSVKGSCISSSLLKGSRG